MLLSQVSPTDGPWPQRGPNVCLIRTLDAKFFTNLKGDYNSGRIKCFNVAAERQN